MKRGHKHLKVVTISKVREAFFGNWENVLMDQVQEQKVYHRELQASKDDVVSADTVS